MEEVGENFEEDNGGYVVMWHMVKNKPQKGLLNSILGNSKKVLIPIIQRYQTHDVALFSYNTIKERGYYQPKLMKVIME